MRVRDRLGIGPEWQVRITYVMELSLVGMLFIGIERGSVGIVLNTGIALAVAQLPPLLERDYDVPLDPALTLWITAAVWLHALGTVGLPGAEQNFYRTVTGWDHVTHALSSSIVAASGYITVRALDRHSDVVQLPRRFVFVFILLFVSAFGVLWEVIEFAVGGLASMTGGQAVLTQYGLEDTMLDLVFDLIGAVIVATWGAAHLSDVVGAVEEWLGNRED
ncbi:hypothetical protein [Halomicrobium salinisoli]|uniref:hypothetical protein n=1 Tax=Halomicrobium salinisoli TaxID=2878391 RepID=UPI001CEFE7F2|nr:hypothetical protein [Halomicrobium salinisoli]